MKIELNVKTQQKVSKVEMRDNGIMNVFVKSSPIENKANAEIIKLLSEYYDIPKSSISIKTGKKSKRKIVEIEEYHNYMV